MSINSNRAIGYLCLLAMLFSHHSYAKDPVDTSIITIGVSYGYYFFDDKQSLDDRDLGGASLGLQFSERFSMALFYARNNVTNEDGSDSRRYENYFLEAAWYFQPISHALRPYIVAGLGETLEAEGKRSDDTTLNAGVGISWALTPRWSLKFDWRQLYGMEKNTLDQTLMSSLVYRFGDPK